MENSLGVTIVNVYQRKELQKFITSDSLIRMFYSLTQKNVIYVRQVIWYEGIMFSITFLFYT